MRIIVGEQVVLPRVKADTRDRLGCEGLGTVYIHA